MPDSVSEICDDAFGNSSLVGIDLPSQMTLIGECAFNLCQSLTHVGMPVTLDSMGESVFGECSNLTSIDIPTNLRVIPEEAFYGCVKLSQITWGNSVAVIDSFAFGGCAFTELQLPSTLRSVRMGAFEGYGRGRLRSVVFTAPVDTIEPEAFSLQSLNTLRFKNTVPPITVTSPEYGADYGCLYMSDVDSVIVPCGSLNAWLTDSYWGQFADKYHEDCNSIEDAAEVRVSVYPNPATDRLTVGGVEGDVHIEIVNTFGQTVLSCAISGNSNEIDVSGLVRGPYFLRIQSSDRVVTTKIILL